MTRAVIWVPLVLLAGFVGIAAVRLAAPVDTTHRSQVIGRTMPAFTLLPAASSRPGVASDQPANAPRLINFFASWCVPCIAEVPVLAELARRGVAIDGIAIRDRRDDLDRFLAQHGNPYRAIGADPQSGTQIAFGSAGVPETFIVDRHGVVRYQHIGPIEPNDLAAIDRAWRDASR